MKFISELTPRGPQGGYGEYIYRVSPLWQQKWVCYDWYCLLTHISGPPWYGFPYYAFIQLYDYTAQYNRPEGAEKTPIFGGKAKIFKVNLKLHGVPGWQSIWLIFALIHLQVSISSFCQSSFSFLFFFFLGYVRIINIFDNI